jgi:hypothetical protein
MDDNVSVDAEKVIAMMRQRYPDQLTVCVQAVIIDEQSKVIEANKMPEDDMITTEDDPDIDR